MENLTIILIALSISADAFSLALAYGLINIRKKQIYISLLVGLFHFIMPLTGVFLGDFLLNKISINPKYIISGIFIFLILQMIKSFSEEKEKFDLNLYNILLFAFFVSIDSFSVGLGLNYITQAPVKACIIFSLFSMTLTYLGFSIGKFISAKIGEISKIVGVSLLAFLVVYYLCK